MLRPATEDDLATLPTIERAAGEAFRALGMDLVADDDPPSVEELRRVVAGGRAWVADHDGEAGRRRGARALRRPPFG